MKTSEIIALSSGIAIFIYLVAFKAYRMHKHPTWKSLMSEIRMWFAEWLLGIIIKVVPPTPSGVRLAKAILDYCESELSGKYEFTNKCPHQHGIAKEQECLDLVTFVGKGFDETAHGELLTTTGFQNESGHLTPNLGSLKCRKCECKLFEKGKGSEIICRHCGNVLKTTLFVARGLSNDWQSMTTAPRDGFFEIKLENNAIVKGEFSLQSDVWFRRLGNGWFHFNGCLPIGWRPI